MFSAVKFSYLWIVLLGFCFTAMAYAADSSLPEQTLVAPPLAETSLSATSPVITFAFFEEPADNVYFKWAELIYREAFRRLGYGFDYKVYPALRASLMADSGKVDGEPGRIFSYGATYPSLIRLDEPLLESYLLAFFADPNIRINSWDDLRTDQYNVEYYRGILGAEQKLKQLVVEDRLTSSPSPLMSLRKLQLGRIDVLIDSNISSERLLRLPEFANHKIYHGEILEHVTSYGYLHKRHAKLVTPLVQVLREMKQEGLLERYFDDVLDAANND